MQEVTVGGADLSDDASFNTTSDTDIDTTYGGDIFFNLTRCVRLSLLASLHSLLTDAGLQRCVWRHRQE
jgi:hypothetical protein